MVLFLGCSGGGGGGGSGSSGGSGGTGAAGGGGSAGAGGGVPGVCCPPGHFLYNSLCLPDDEPLYRCGFEYSGQPCTTMNADATCMNGACAEVCHPSFGDCDGKPGECETSLTTPQNCGACGNACAPGEVCTSAGCAPSCAPPLTNCNGACVDLLSSPRHCGGCNKNCPAPIHAKPTCSLGTCGFECLPGFTLCGDKCVDASRDPKACGASCTPCAPPKGGFARCDGGACAAACPAGFTLCGDACVDLATSKAHCGACNAPCAGTCVAGVCDPALSEVIAVADKPTDIQVDATQVYFIESGTGSILRVSKWGGPVTVLVAGQAKPTRIAVDDTHLYWTNALGASVMRVPKAGGPPMLVSAASEPSVIAVSGDEVFWVNASDRTVMKAPKDGSGAALTLWTDVENVVSMRVDETHVYTSPPGFASGPVFQTYVKRGPRDGSDPVELFSTAEGGLALDAERAYFDMMYDSGIGIVGMSKVDKKFTQLSYTGGLAVYNDLEVDESYVYYAGQRSLKCGSSVPSYAPTGNSFVVDGGYVYLTTESSNEVRRLPR